MFTNIKHVSSAELNTAYHGAGVAISARTVSVLTGALTPELNQPSRLPYITPHTQSEFPLPPLLYRPIVISSVGTTPPHD